MTAGIADGLRCRAWPPRQEGFPEVALKCVHLIEPAVERNEANVATASAPNTAPKIPAWAVVVDVLQEVAEHDQELRTLRNSREVTEVSVHVAYDANNHAVNSVADRNGDWSTRIKVPEDASPSCAANPSPTDPIVEDRVRPPHQPQDVPPHP